jgi:putative DNA primase/helicase
MAKRITGSPTDSWPNSGILLWALDGLDRLRRRGRFLQPQSSAEAIRNLEDLGSPMSVFVRERCIVEPGAEVETSALYYDWRDFCTQHGRDRPGTSQSFGRDLKAAVPGITTADRKSGADRWRAYVGITLL